MKKLLTLLLFTVSVLPLFAQDYAPFRMGHTPYFQAGDSIYSLRITSVQVQGSDSVFEFNPRIVPEPLASFSGQVRNPDNLFGGKMIKQVNNEYRFEFDSGAEYQLKPTAPVGATWTFSQLPSITATLQNKAIEMVQGNPDSVVTISLSNGNLIKIGRSFGLVSSQSFYSYHSPNSTTQNLALIRLPESGIGYANNAFSIYDFQVGDKFLYDGFANEGFAPCYKFWKTIEVLSRNQNQDSIWYSFRKQLLTISYPGFGLALCNSASGTNIPAGTFLGDFDTVNFVVKHTGYPHLTSVTREYKIHPQPWFRYLNQGQYSNTFSGRLSSDFGILYLDTLMGTYKYVPDGSGNTTYTEGLGQVNYQYEPKGREKLIAYIKGTETYGTWAPLTGTRDDVEKQSLLIYPNPFTSEFTLQLPEGNSEAAEVTVYNLQGHQVFRQKVSSLASETGVNLRLGHLPKGLYLLHLQQGEKSYSAKVQRQ